jgi:hypothetical protein
MEELKSHNFYERVSKELIDLTEIDIIGGDLKDGVYIRFPLTEGWMNKRNYLMEDKMIKEYIEKMLNETYGIPRKEITTVYENYYRSDLLKILLEYKE